MAFRINLANQGDTKGAAMRRFWYLTIPVIFLLGSALADDGKHAPFEYFRGHDVELVKEGSILTGTFGNVKILAESKCPEFMKGSYAIHDVVTHFEIVWDADEVVGTFGDKMVRVKDVDTDKAELTLVGPNQEVVPVQIQMAGTEGEHVVNVGFTFTANGKAHTVKLEGEACWGRIQFYSVMLYALAIL